nr:phospholipase-like protein [Tanacetum cinerariifolium]
MTIELLFRSLKGYAGANTRRQVQEPIVLDQQTFTQVLAFLLRGETLAVADTPPQHVSYYEGVVESFDRSKMKHKVLYDDGDEDVLNLNVLMKNIAMTNELGVVAYEVVAWTQRGVPTVTNEDVGSSKGEVPPEKVSSPLALPKKGVSAQALPVNDLSTQTLPINGSSTLALHIKDPSAQALPRMSTQASRKMVRSTQAPTKKINSFLVHIFFKLDANRRSLQRSINEFVGLYVETENSTTQGK